MKAACLIVLGLMLTAQVQETEEGLITKEKWKSDHTEKTWGLKLKTVKYTTNLSPSNVSVLLEFTKDLPADDLRLLKEAFNRKEGAMEFCFFDQDGVIFTKLNWMHYVVEGDVSGRKGDVVRCRMSVIKNGPLHFMLFPGADKKVSKVELRPTLSK